MLKLSNQFKIKVYILKSIYFGLSGFRQSDRFLRNTSQKIVNMMRFWMQISIEPFLLNIFYSESSMSI